MTGLPNQEPQTRREVVAGWGLLVVRLLARGYLVFLLALAACAVVPMVTGLTGSIVQSGSMMPHIAVGDVVLSHPLAVDAKTPMGHVVTFPAPPGSEVSGIRLHRIVGSNPDGTLITAGDANPDADSAPLLRSNIIAVACLLIPWIGLPAFWLQHGQLLPFAGWLAVTLLALLIEFLASQAETKERRELQPQPVGPRRRGIPALVHRMGIESALSIGALILCGVMVAIAPFTPVVNAAFTASTRSAGNSWVAAVSATPAKLVFATNPSNSTGGVAFGTQPVVAIQTSTGGSTTSTAPVTLQLTTPAGATLTCSSNPRAGVTGIAAFSGCAIDKAGGYTLTATSPGLTSAVSSTVTITVGPAKNLVFTTTPLNTARNTAFTNQPVVAVKDAGGNTVTGSTASITLALNGTGGGALTNCASNPKSAVAGVVTFSGCRVNQVGQYTLTATSGTLTSATSASFWIFNTASKLVFLASPSSSLSGAAFGTQPVVAIEDSSGDITSGTGAVTLAITTPNGATLTCATNPITAVNGTATFAGCAIGKSGTYTLRATSSSLTAATSASFTISAGPAARVAFTASPSNTTSATAFATQPVVTVLDTFGNTITTNTAAVALSLTTPNGATLTCTANPKNAVAGVATYAGCRVDKVGSYTLTATSSGLTSAVSSSFTISTGSATKLVFTTSPGNAVHNVTFPIQPIVEIQDAGGNLVTGTTLVLLSITPPANGANLTCSSNPVLNFDGEVNFGGCRIDRAGTYTLTASASGLTSGTSLSFVVS
jgi:signal peptidase I